MKKNLPLLFAVLAFQGAATAAPISISGTTTKSENFDSLGTADAAWTDDSTLPGWYAQINNGTTANGNLQVDDGNNAFSGLVNVGMTGAPDRALGSKATGTGNFANIAYAVSFQNTGATPTKLSLLKYTGEMWRANTTANTVENFTVYYQISNAPITNIISGTNSATPAAGAGFTAVGAAADWSLSNAGSGVALDGNDAANKLEISFAPPSIIVGPGQYLMIKFTDQNEAGTDGYQAIDDFSAEFTAVSGLVTAAVSNFTRNVNGTVNDPTDDTFGFTVNVTGSGAVAAGWTTADVNPPAGNTSAANYGVPVVWTGFPVSAPKTITISDAVTATLNTVITVSAQPIIGSNDIVTVGTPILADGTPITGWVVDEAARTLTQNAQTVQADFVVNSSVIDLSTTGFATLTAELDAISGASSGFEAADAFGLEVIINGAAPVNILGGNDVDNNGRLNGGAAGAGSELPDAGITNTTKPFTFTYLIPDTANTLQIRIIGNSNSGSETYLVKNIKLNPPSATLFAGPAGPVTVNTKGTVDPSDDEFSAPVNVNGVNLGASTGWHSDEVPQRTGLYATPNPVIFGPYQVSGGARTIILTDNANAAITSAPLTLTPPASTVYVIGQANLGAGTVNVFSDPATTPDPLWVNVAAQRTLTMSAGVATNSVVTSETLNLSAVGAVQFSATFRANETSTGSNFEVTDKFKAELIIDGVTHNLISTWDKGDGNGATVGTGLNGPPDGYLNGYNGVAGVDVVTQVAYAAAADDYNTNAARDEFNLTAQQVVDAIDNSFPLTFSIPAAANSVQLVITGTGAAGSEFFTVSNVLFSTGGGGPVDTDGDGVSDTDEGIMGTSTTDPNDVLRLTQNPATPTQIQFPSKTGKFYRVYSSTNVATGPWTGSGVTIAGDNTVKTFTIVTTGGPRLYYRLHVMATDGPWVP